MVSIAISSLRLVPVQPKTGLDVSIDVLVLVVLLSIVVVVTVFRSTFMRRLLLLLSASFATDVAVILLSIAISSLFLGSGTT